MYNCNPIYSLIIPHKNCPVLLNRLMDTIPIREDLQIIVIDDNSEVALKPVITRNDVEVVLLDAKQAKGAGRARNVGIDRARGKWILFADADDCYTDSLSYLLDKYADDEINDIVYFNAYMFNDYGIISKLGVSRFIQDYMDGKKKAEKELRFGCWTPWMKMVKRKIVQDNRIRFDEVPFGNDVSFGLQTGLLAKRFSVEERMIYKYYQWPKGSMTQPIRDKLVEHHLILRSSIISFHKKVGYHTCNNLFSIIEALYREGKISLIQAFVFYWKYLNEYHILFGDDFSKYAYSLFFNRIPHRLKMLFS